MLIAWISHSLLTNVISIHYVLMLVGPLVHILLDVVERGRRLGLRLKEHKMKWIPSWLVHRAEQGRAV